jgi:hypothetical protein
MQTAGIRRPFRWQKKSPAKKLAGLQKTAEIIVS